MEAEKIIEAILNNRRVMEKEKTILKTQIEKKNWEINSLNKKLNKTFGELQSLKSDKINLEEQIVNHYIVFSNKIFFFYF
jgi:predicted  nucleic acid-binding Zn-ribbon protein